MMLVVILGVFCILLLARTLHILYKIRHDVGSPLMLPGRSVRTLVVLGSGGHTGEMLQLVGALDPHRYFPRAYLTAASDAISLSRLTLTEEAIKAKTDPRDSSHTTGSDPTNKIKTHTNQYCIEVVPRSREVGQGWASTCLSTLWSLIFCSLVVARHRPALVLTNGPGTCVPVCLVALVLRILGICQNRIVFVESLCRVKSLSLSGQILYHLADDFLVQWPGLSDTYPRSKYLGRLI